MKTYRSIPARFILALPHDGRGEMDSNFVEKRVRRVKNTAENALFAGHPQLRIHELLPWNYDPTSS